MFARETHRQPRNGRIHTLTTQKENGQRTRNTLKIATINISTLRGKEEELVTLMEERKLTLLGLCETCWSGSGRRVLHHDFQLIYSGGNVNKHGVAILVSPNIVDRIKDTHQISERIVSISLKMDKGDLKIIQVYAPQQGRTAGEKEEFYQTLQDEIDLTNGDTVIMGDLNGHVGVDRDGFKTVVGAFGIGDRNSEGVRLLDFYVLNTYFKHKDEHKWTWYRWSYETGKYL